MEVFVVTWGGMDTIVEICSDLPKAIDRAKDLTEKRMKKLGYNEKQKTRNRSWMTARFQIYKFEIDKPGKTLVTDAIRARLFNDELIPSPV